MREQERFYREHLAKRESHDVREQAAGVGPVTKRPTYDAGYVGLQPRPWCQVLERALGVPPEDCLFAVSRETIYAVVADPRRERLRGVCGRDRARVGAEIARIGASSRSVKILAVSRRSFEAARAAQRMGGDAAALAVLKPGESPPPSARAFGRSTKEYASAPL